MAVDFHNLDIDAVIRAASQKGALVPFANNPVNTSGFFTSAQKAPFTKVSAGDTQSRLPQYLPQFMADGTPVTEVCSAISEADRNRLVKAAKCPTQTKRSEKAREQWVQDNDALRQKQIRRELLGHHNVPQTVSALEINNPVVMKYRKYYPWGPVVCCDPAIKTATPEFTNLSAPDFFDPETGEISRHSRKAEGENGQLYTVITHREWSGEYRIRTQIDQCHALPPEQEGERVSTQLSLNGAKKIADSCHYMHLEKGGYKTFLTLTVEPEQRKRLEEGEITLQKELGRFWDAMNKVRQRGFTYYVDESGEVLPSKKGAFQSVKVEPAEVKKIMYCWVIENPLNEDGERNPHIHILMDWGMKYVHFRGWAQRVEKLWGHGFAHLEKMKDTANAGAYIAKAAGYMSKANGSDDQGPVKGNRYGISTESRAPEWVQVGRYEAGHMGHLIKDVYDYFSHLYGPLFAKRKQLNSDLDATPKAEKEKRHRIGKALAKVREKCNALPAIASKYQLLIKGREKFNEFISWASSERAERPNDWLPAKDEEEGWNGNNERPDSNWSKEFKMRLFHRKAGRRWSCLTAKHYQKWVEPEREKPSFWDWLSYEEWGLGA